MGDRQVFHTRQLPAGLRSNEHLRDLVSGLSHRARHYAWADQYYIRAEWRANTRWAACPFAAYRKHAASTAAAKFILPPPYHRHGPPKRDPPNASMGAEGS